jgi:parallel beta-helix repeat protein
MATHILEKHLTRFALVVETVINADGVRETAIVLDDGDEGADGAGVHTPSWAQRKVNRMRYVHVFPRKQSALGLSAAVVTLLTVTGSVAAVECGDVLTGVERLDDDLICTTDPALTLSGGRLNLRGHRVICEGTIEGVVLDGDGAQIRNGAVTGCQFALVVEGAGNHLITNVTASVQDPVLDDEEGAEGLRVSSDDNRLIRNRVLGGSNAIRINGAGNRVEGNLVGGSERGIRIDGIENVVADNVIAGIGEGIEVRGASNRIRRNQIAGAIDQGIELRGAGKNRVVGNLAVGAVGDGISIFSNENVIRGNGVFRNGDDGIIVVEGFGSNRIVNNSALGNGTDLADQNRDCDDNVWANNTFGSADPDGCIDERSASAVPCWLAPSSQPECGGTARGGMNEGQGGPKF